MNSFSALSNNSFGDFNKEDILGFIDKMTHKSKKAELVLKEHVDVLNREREFLTTKVAAFEKVIANLEQHLSDEKENVRQALMEKDELRKKISVERDQSDSVLARKEKELANSEREILQFVQEREALNARLSELETKSRRYDDIKASVNTLRLDAEPDAIKTAEEAQEQVVEAAHIIDGIAEEVESMKKQFGSYRREPTAPIASAPYADTFSEPVPISPPAPSTYTADPKPVRGEHEESNVPDTATLPRPDADIANPDLPKLEPEQRIAEPGSKHNADDPIHRLNALYQALDESMERLQEIKTQFVKSASPSMNDQS